MKYINGYAICPTDCPLCSWRLGVNYHNTIKITFFRYEGAIKMGNVKGRIKVAIHQCPFAGKRNLDNHPKLSNGQTQKTLDKQKIITCTK